MQLLRVSPLLLLCASSIASTGCLQSPEPASQAAVEEAPKAEPPAPAVEPVTAATNKGLQPTTEPLTAEEERLIAADPKTLSTDELRMRGHALRKRVMLNPNSDAAQALNDARAAVLAGEVDPLAPEGQVTEDKGLVLQAPPHLRQPPPSEPK
jgi:hypothetical protein